ncbi:MAG: enoyl-CoA hydratase/isomerase family protein, partial [Desulfobacula sp.]|nr:enoyl-CoA hydratase/isomerase family protein [Desulfobacula sp.]
MLQEFMFVIALNFCKGVGSNCFTLIYDLNGVEEKKMTYKKILFSTEGSIGILTLNSPKTINALSKRMIEEMIDALSKVSTDESVKVIIIRAAG